ncbi:hypothetical protein Ddc_03837 [Ditylenchus destructor]|nr:hypothetical protein Ddc_03837 [Ditylenchus destructor]
MGSGATVTVGFRIKPPRMRRQKIAANCADKRNEGGLTTTTAEPPKITTLLSFPHLNTENGQQKRFDDE